MSKRKTTLQEKINESEILNKVEVMACVDEWLSCIEKKKFKFSISEFAAECLKKELTLFRMKIAATYIPPITKPLTHYCLDLFYDRIALGITTVIPNTDSNATFLQDDEEDYKRMITQVIRPCPLNEWAEKNDVKPATVRQWINRERMKAIKNGRDLYISPIQYHPDAPFESSERSSLRYKMIGTLPATITDKWPALCGEVLDIFFSPNDENWNITCITIKPESKKTNIYQSVISDSEKRKMVFALNRVKGVHAQSDKWYINPLGDASMKGKERPNIVPTVDKEATTIGTLTGKTGEFGLPTFTLTSYFEDEEKKYTVKGYVNRESTAEGCLLSAIFAPDIEENKVSSYLVENMPDFFAPKDVLNKNAVYITDIDFTSFDDKDDSIAFLRNISEYAKLTFLQYPALIVLLLDKKDPKKETKAKLLADAGYKIVRTVSKIEKMKNKTVYYGYSAFASSVATVEQPSKRRAHAILKLEKEMEGIQQKGKQK